MRMLRSLSNMIMQYVFVYFQNIVSSHLKLLHIGMQILFQSNELHIRLVKKEV